MKEIKITNGTVKLKDFCSRKLRKELNKIMFEGAEIGTDEKGKAEIKGIKPETLEKANDALLIGMIDEIVINDVVKPINIEILDEMDDKDVKEIILEANKIVNPQEEESPLE